MLSTISIKNKKCGVVSMVDKSIKRKLKKVKVDARLWVQLAKGRINEKKQGIKNTTKL
jgi:hypothetical protein